VTLTATGRHAHPSSRQFAHTTFAHTSEEDFARLLTLYGLAWSYEPREFVLRRDDHGAVRAAMRPDFYLPELDAYVELTTMRQSLVTRKNHKVRLLREVHPSIDLTVVYRRDFEQLLASHRLASPREEHEAS
jgi:hypothetical protein